MACCVFTAYVMNRLIKACEVLDLNLITVQYNEFDDGPELIHDDASSKSTVVSKFTIDGMTCQACVTSIENAVNALRGIEAISISLPLYRASVVHNKALTSVSEILQAIESKGYEARLGERNAQQNLETVQQVAQLQSLQAAFQQAMILASVIITIDWINGWISFTSGVRQPLILLVGFWVQLVVAWPIHQQAWRSGPFSSPSMDTLISLSLLLGLALSAWRMVLCTGAEAAAYFSSGSFLTAVVLGGRYLDALLKRQGAASLAQLYELQAETSLVKIRPKSSAAREKCFSNEFNQNDDKMKLNKGGTKSSNLERVPALLLKPGDEILVDAGVIIPCDCYVTNGKSMVDQSIMTGESLPAAKSPGDFLMSGTRNMSAELAAIVSKPQEDSSLEQLVSSISIATEDQSSGSSGYLTSSFVKIILFIALSAAVATYLLNHEDLSNALRLEKACERAMAILASACPCALGLASPSAVMSGVSIAWTRGIIITGGSKTIEKLASLTHIVMDKTGTLTTGRLNVAYASTSLSAQQCMLICAAERQDALVHPVACALFKWALSQLDEDQRSLQNSLNVTELSNTSGQGVTCRVSGLDMSSNVSNQEIHIGNARFLRESGIETCIEGVHQRGSGITVHFAVDHKQVATIYLQDEIRRETPPVIQALRSQLNISLTMLTGDNEIEAQRVAQTLNIPVLSARALPAEKRSFVEQLQSDTGCQAVAMVGDGLNDASAISAADVGILVSPGLSRTNITCAQIANVILASSNLAALADLVFIARATAKQIQFNIRWAITYNVVAVAVAAGALELWGFRIDAAMAGTLMAFSSISVLAWSLWFRRRLLSTRFTVPYT